MGSSEVDPRTAGIEGETGQSPWADAWKRLRKNRMAMAGVVITGVMALLSTLADDLLRQVRLAGVHGEHDTFDSQARIRPVFS